MTVRQTEYLKGQRVVEGKAGNEDRRKVEGDSETGEGAVRSRI